MRNDEDMYIKKALVVTTVASTLDQFCMSDISILQNSYQVYVAANFSIGNNTPKERVREFKSELIKKNIVVNEINFNRNPISKFNFLAYKAIKNLIDNNFFDLIHCHTPVAAMIVRLAAKNARKKGTKVIYTAHGFHFFKGASFVNWFIYYPVEKWLARYTDVLITINKEDYERAKKFFKASKVMYVPGVGIDVDKFSKIKIDRKSKRTELALPQDAFVVLSVGELNKNKNHETIIRAVAKLNNPKIHYVICGQGSLKNYLEDLIKKLGLEMQVHLLGFREDIAEIYKASDLFAFPSYREGLSVALMEAMASGLPVVCSDIRGNIDLIEDGKGGFMCKPDDIDGFATAIHNIMENNNLTENFKRNNKDKILMYSINEVKEKMSNLYEELITKVRMEVN